MTEDKQASVRVHLDVTDRIVDRVIHDLSATILAAFLAGLGVGILGALSVGG